MFYPPLIVLAHSQGYAPFAQVRSRMKLLPLLVPFNSWEVDGVYSGYALAQAYFIQIDLLPYSLRLETELQRHRLPGKSA